MRFAFFYHSARSDWNHGNAHFLRGLVRSLTGLGHTSVCYEAARGWSVTNLVAGAGLRPLVEFKRRFSFVDVRLYDPQPLGALERRLELELGGVDVVVLHEWPAVEQPALLQLLLRLRRRCGYRLLFHDTHYRTLTQPARIARLGLERCDAILAFSPSLAATYRECLGLGPERVHVVHEAADDALFHPLPPDPHLPLDDALFVGNWGGPDRASELRAFYFRPARRLRAERRFALYGVRYPPEFAARAPGALRDRLPRLAAQSPRPASPRPGPGRAAHPPPAVRAGAPRHADDPRLRGTGVRRASGQHPLAGHRRTLPGRRGLRRRGHPETDGGGPAVAVAGRGGRATPGP